MVKIFWVTCPECGRESYAQYGDFRHTDNEIVCPFCQASFLDEEAAEIVE